MLATLRLSRAEVAQIMAALNEIKCGYDPAQPRDRDGQWSDGLVEWRAAAPESGTDEYRMWDDWLTGLVTSPDESFDDQTLALLLALHELAGGIARAWTPERAKLHPRGPDGRFRSTVDRLKEAIDDHRAGRGEGHPFEAFDREQLRKAAKARGIRLDRGESRQSIAAKLLGHLDSASLESAQPYEARLKAAGAGRKALDAAPLSMLPRSRTDPALTPERRKLLNDLRTGEAGDVEAALRDGGEVTDDTARRIGVIDGVMAASPLASDVLLYQTAPTARDVFGDAARGDLAGHEFVEHRFAEVTAAKPHQLKAPGHRGLVMQILAPKGMGAVALSAGWQEVLLDRKHTWRVVKDHGRNEAGLRIVDVEILPKSVGAADNYTIVTTRITSAESPLPAEVAAALPDSPLGRGLKSGYATSQVLAGGNVGDVRLAVFNNGSRAVQKVARRAFARRTPTDLADSEELGGLLGRAIGAPVPEVARTGDAEVFMEYVPDAKSGAAALARRDAKLSPFVNSRGGRLLGVLDLIADNSDRHDGNWLVRPDGTIAGIDHGLLWSSRRVDVADIKSTPPVDRAGSLGNVSPFVKPFHDDGNWQANDLSPADVAWMRRQIEALRPQFEARGRGYWLDYSLTRLDQLGEHAAGKRNRVRP